MVTVFELLPDEILLLICQYLSQNQIIKGFLNLNFRLNCTISRYTGSYTVSDIYDVKVFELIRNEIRSLTVKNNRLTSNQIRAALNIEELNLIRTDPINFVGLEYLTDLNIHFVSAFPSILALYSQNKHIHSVYIEPNQPLTIPEFNPEKISSIKQLAIHIDSMISFLRILRTFPELTCLNLVLDECELNDSKLTLPSIKTPEYLSIFSLRLPYEFIINFQSLKSILNYLPSTLEYLSISIQTTDRTCFDGQIWEKYIQQTFSQLIRLEFFIFFKYERYGYISDLPLKLPLILQTFQNSYWSTIVPQTINGYLDRNGLYIYTEPIPGVARRRYFLN